MSGSRFAYRLEEHSAPEPDVAFVHRDRVQAMITDKDGIGPPDVAVEIVSRDSKSRDYVKKKALYERTGVREYWLLDPLKQQVEFNRLDGSTYRVVPLEENRIFRSQAFPGFWLDIAWLFPPADVWSCSQHLLAAD